MTQTDVARRWGRAQSRVSTLESDITRPEVSTLMEYVHALGGTLEIRVTVNDHTYIEQLV
jgi:predicted transcriptional regulator